MSNVIGIGDAYHWSVFKIAEAFGLHRDTVKKRLLAANTPVVATVKGNPVYALQHVGPALFGPKHEAVDSVHDPSRMEPKERKDWYQSENERIKLEKEQRKLIPVDEVVIVYSSMRKAVVQVLETIPDILERDCALTPQAVGVVQQAIDDLRYTLQEKSYEACAAELISDEEGESLEEE
ncbi:DUF1441 family protein [Escherichia coli]|uniref:DUF1441 family protein n=1 Tax=Escherichia coli TaxID=562 RepID=UPI00207BDBF6|nr:DUF1441 family protein [Escherichia coli]